MVYIFIGSLAFLFLFLFDIYTLSNDGIRKKIFGAIGLALLMYSAIMATVVSDKIPLPLTVRLSSLVLCIGAGFMLIYSLFLELPFVNTYGKEQHSSTLVDTGTYALCRHPGVLWFGMLFYFYFFATGAVLIIWGGILWTCMDILHVYLQEKLFFPKMFPTYGEYMKTTPMLIPNKASVKKCALTIFRWGNKNGELRGNVKTTRV